MTPNAMRRPAVPPVPLRAAGAALLALTLAATGAVAEPFADSAGGFAGDFRVSGPDRGPVLAGSAAAISGRGLEPGQQLTLRQGGAPLNGGAVYTADDRGTVSAEVTIPDGVAPGTYPVVAELSNPSWETVFDLKVSAVLPDSGADDYALSGVQLDGGLYQAGYLDSVGALFVTAAAGRGAEARSTLFKLDPDTLAVEAQAQPPAVPAGTDGKPAGVFAAYGLGLDPDAGTVWVTNTRQNTVAVYSADDLSLVKQFPPDLVGHPREVAVGGGRAFVGATFEPVVQVFDTAKLEPAGRIYIPSGTRGASFGAAGLAVDAQGGRLVVSSLSTDEIAVIDLAAPQAAPRVIPVTGASGLISVAVDGADGRAFVVGQASDTVAVVDLTSGEVLGSVAVGADPLNVAWDAAAGLAFVAVRGADRVVAIAPDGTLRANLPVGSYPNQLTPGPDGAVYLVNKARGDGDPQGNHVTRITPKS